MSFSRIMNMHFIGMRMSVEDSTNDRIETLDNAVELTGPNIPASAVTRWNVCEDVYKFTVLFSFQQSVLKPHQLPLHVGAIIK